MKSFQKQNTMPTVRLAELEEKTHEYTEQIRELQKVVKKSQKHIKEEKAADSTSKIKNSNLGSLISHDSAIKDIVNQ